MKRLLKTLIPASLRKKIHARMIDMLTKQDTVAEGWDKYAQKYQSAKGNNLGDEWNRPEVIGIDVPADQIVAYLDQKIFTPFLGNSNTILEIGAGGGRFTEILVPKCNKLIATDTSPNMISLLKKRFSNIRKVEYLLLDGLGLSPIPDNSIDAVFSYGVFVHLQHWDIYNYLQEIKRILKPGGKVIIQHANTFSEMGWEYFLGDLSTSLNRHKLPGSFTLMTPDIIREFTQRAGLKLEKCITDVVRRDCISLITCP